MRKILFYLFPVFVCTLLLSFSVIADEISEQINEALQLYEKGEFSEAISGLKYAVTQIQQIQEKNVKEILPAPLKGWKADGSVSKTAPAAFLGGGITASRHYYSEDSARTVDIDIIADSPIVQSMMMFITNPSLISMQPDTKLVKIKNRKTIQKFSAEQRNGEITVVVLSNVIVMIKGANMDSVDDLVSYAKAVDYEAIEKLFSVK
jgi:hypothetical protein